MMEDALPAPSCNPDPANTSVPNMNFRNYTTRSTAAESRERSFHYYSNAINSWSFLARIGRTHLRNGTTRRSDQHGRYILFDRIIVIPVVHNHSTK